MKLFLRASRGLCVVSLFSVDIHVIFGRFKIWSFYFLLFHGTFSVWSDFLWGTLHCSFLDYHLRFYGSSFFSLIFSTGLMLSFMPVYELRWCFYDFQLFFSALVMFTYDLTCSYYYCWLGLFSSFRFLSQILR